MAKRTSVIDELDLPRGILGETAGSIELETYESARRVALDLAKQTKRELVLLSQDLEPELYDNRVFLDEVRRIALYGRGTPVRILLCDAEPAVRRGHGLIEMARSMTSRLQIQAIPEEFQQDGNAYQLADKVGYLLRRFAANPDATADFKDARTVRRLRERFEEIWSLGAIHQKLRRLYL